MADSQGNGNMKGAGCAGSGESFDGNRTVDISMKWMGDGAFASAGRLCVTMATCARIDDTEMSGGM